MSTIVGIDTSSSELSIGVYREGLPFYSITRFSTNSHAEHISMEFSHLMNSCQIKPEEIEKFAVSIGPGSFTGLRIGIAFVKGFCFGNNKITIIPVSSLQVLAYGAADYNNKRIITIIDARNENFYWASFYVRDNIIVRLTEDDVISKENFLSLLKENDIVVIDSFDKKNKNILSKISQICNTVETEKVQIHRGLICAAYGHSKIGENSLWITSDKLKPNYIRKSAPEEKKQKE